MAIYETPFGNPALFFQIKREWSKFSSSLTKSDLDLRA
jgi:hypothetical protein